MTLSRGSIALIIRGSIANYIILFKIIPVRHNVYGTGNVFWVTVPDVGSTHCPGCLRGLCQAGKSEIPNSFRTGKCFSLEWSIGGDFYTWVFIAWSQQKKGITLDFHMKWAQEQLLTTKMFGLELFFRALPLALFALKISASNSHHPFFLGVHWEMLPWTLLPSHFLPLSCELSASPPLFLQSRLTVSAGFGQRRALHRAQALRRARGEWAHMCACVSVPARVCAWSAGSCCAAVSCRP